MNFGDSDGAFAVFNYSAVLDKEVRLEVTIADPCRWSHEIHELVAKHIDLSIQDNGPWQVRTRSSGQAIGWRERERDFVEHWLPQLRRGCWLSGCDIEASAHEKMEWLQGLTREELETWNLKM